MCRIDEPRYPPLVGILIGVVVSVAWLIACASFFWHVVGPAWRRLVGA